MAGSFDYNPYPPQLALDATPIGVFLYDSGADEWPGLHALAEYPLRPDPVQGRDRAAGRALSRTSLTRWRPINNGWPSQFDQIWPLTVTPSPYVVANDDELVVLALYAR